MSDCWAPYRDAVRVVGGDLEEGWELLRAFVRALNHTDVVPGTPAAVRPAESNLTRERPDAS